MSVQTLMCAALVAATGADFTFTHGDGWTTGGAPLRVDTRADWTAPCTRKTEWHSGHFPSAPRAQIVIRVEA
jgi:hypothetical protein